VDGLRLGILDRRSEFGAVLAGYLSRHGIDADLHAESDPLIRRMREATWSLLVVHQDGATDVLPTLHQIRTLSRLPCVIIGEPPDGGIGLLDAGADDLMSRQTPLPTMLARMRAVLRRGAWGPATQTAAEADAAPCWQLWRGRRELRHPGGAECRLTTAEFDLFCLLVDRAPSPVTRDAICREVFRRRWRGDDRTVDNLIVRLRRKLDDPGRRVIRTVQGRGYAFAGFDGVALHQV
jgi:DNA-binding response OmpR family regulator